MGIKSANERNFRPGKVYLLLITAKGTAINTAKSVLTKPKFNALIIPSW